MYLSKQSFGRHVRSLRKARGLTQEALADLCGVAVDTIRRLESGSFSPSLDTLTKVGLGMNLRLSTMFESCEYGATSGMHELTDLIATRSRRDLDLAGRVLRSIFDELDARVAQVRVARPMLEDDEDEDAESEDAESEDADADADDKDAGDKDAGDKDADADAET